MSCLMKSYVFLLSDIGTLSNESHRRSMRAWSSTDWSTFASQPFQECGSARSPSVPQAVRTLYYLFRSCRILTMRHRAVCCNGLARRLADRPSVLDRAHDGRDYANRLLLEHPDARSGRGWSRAGARARLLPAAAGGWLEGHRHRCTTFRARHERADGGTTLV